jgi:hypothetical protein
MRTKLIFISALLAGAALASDEITVSASAKLASGSVLQSQASGELKLTMTAAVPVYAGAVALLSNAATQTLDTAAVASKGYLWGKNASTNGYIRGGPTNAAGAMLPVVELRPGEVQLLPSGSEILYWTSTVTNQTAFQWFMLTR